jgi:hypothetical protein
MMIEAQCVAIGDTLIQFGHPFDVQSIETIVKGADQDQFRFTSTKGNLMVRYGMDEVELA